MSQHWTVFVSNHAIYMYYYSAVLLVYQILFGTQSYKHKIYYACQVLRVKLTQWLHCENPIMETDTTWHNTASMSLIWIFALHLNWLNLMLNCIQELTYFCTLHFDLIYHNTAWFYLTLRFSILVNRIKKPDIWGLYSAIRHAITWGSVLRHESA